MPPPMKPRRLQAAGALQLGRDLFGRSSPSTSPQFKMLSHLVTTMMKMMMMMVMGTCRCHTWRACW
eukprot:6120270-Alexandrium_andersonii.AAC.1